MLLFLNKAIFKCLVFLYTNTGGKYPYSSTFPRPLVNLLLQKMPSFYDELCISTETIALTKSPVAQTAKVSGNYEMRGCQTKGCFLCKRDAAESLSVFIAHGKQFGGA